ncbi:preprotein translocase subunit SCY2, chloroplastic [Ananas comosus]|uniref:Preprotein translocase subunit SCY2, chloroplastic n=1 Tax=Ananas comosus TaxID=4615 RepID=A0A6P5GB23_ANACO|nr:preprotein translocase subunit SCY2, chloroplastic [Ananas comosus]
MRRGTERERLFIDRWSGRSRGSFSPFLSTLPFASSILLAHGGGALAIVLLPPPPPPPPPPLPLPLRPRPFVVYKFPSPHHHHRSLCSHLKRTLTLSSPTRRFPAKPTAAAAAAAAAPSDAFGAEGRSGRGERYKNRFLDLGRIGSVVDGAADAFFKSEIRRRLAVTAALIVLSRVGYFVPLPGFDRRLIPETYLSFTPGAADDLGDFTAELKLSLFQLGISHQISASILMQVLCHIVPSLVKLRKEGLDGQEKIKGYIWWTSLGFAILGAIIVSSYSLQYSVYAASHRFKHIIMTSILLVVGAMTMTWICDTISESGFGHGSSLIICASILTSYTETLYKMLSQLAGNLISCWPYIFGILGIFTVVTMWAVLLTEGCRKIKLQYYAFKLASSTRNEGSAVTEVEPYIPFNINPTGMQPVLTTTYLLAFPGIMASIFGTPFWETMKEILNPRSSVGAYPWVYYTIYALFVFLFNIFDIANLPKEIADYMTKMGARIPKIKPGKATIEHLTKIQASTRFWGGLLLSVLATSSTLLDHYLKRINKQFAIGFTSVLIIVGSIIELRRSYQAYNVMPALSKVLRRYGVPQ